ncbi:MAG TPA: tetratricopeptide repeat protein [Flavobacteriaceae bacterium]|nr:tetratricopeptide repeat protein [Flavobacteriaceae bacterium]HEX5743122.1 tetratricopeptide repeat protein [Flavobacteriaceae bacterium]
MKRLITIIWMFIGLAINAQTKEVLFEQANQLYKNNDFKNAITNYQKIIKSGMHSDALYFNLANAYYKSNEVAPAIYYYEKTLKLNPLHEDAKYNLVLANRMTIDQIDEMPKTLIQRIETNFLHKISVETWSIIAVVLSFITALLFLIYYFSFSTFFKQIFFTISIVTFTTMIFAVLIALKGVNYDKNHRPAIIFSEKAVIKNAPTFNSEDVFILHEGTKVEVLDTVDDWYKIKLVDGKIGWVKKSVLKII